VDLPLVRVEVMTSCLAYLNVVPDAAVVFILVGAFKSSKRHILYISLRTGDFMTNEISRWKFINMIARWIVVHTRKAALHQSLHVGAFAGSYLERRDWDHL
jgi:hypothetical protein